MRKAYRWVVLPDRPRNVWVIETLHGKVWEVDSTHLTRRDVRDARADLMSTYGIPSKYMRIRAYVPDPFLNRDRRVSR
jgi:hypothetical protein